MDISSKKPALKLKGEQRPAIAIPQRRTAPVIVAPPDQRGAAVRVSQWPGADALDAWVDAGDEYTVRFSCVAGQTRGNVGAGEWEYFRSDCASAMEWAALIGGTLGFSPPRLAAIVEPERAACYRQLAAGFAGAYSGPGSTVDNIIAIP